MATQDMAFIEATECMEDMEAILDTVMASEDTDMGLVDTDMGLIRNQAFAINNDLISKPVDFL